MVHAGVSELLGAFRAHHAPAGIAQQSRNLLLFYAVECGLKAAWLRRNSLATTAGIDPKMFEGQDGHDLTLWAKELKMPATVTRSLRFQLKRDKGQTHSIAVAHQVWRYGVGMNPSDEAKLEKWLEQVWQWTKEEINS